MRDEAGLSLPANVHEEQMSSVRKHSILDLAPLVVLLDEILVAEHGSCWGDGIRSAVWALDSSRTPLWREGVVE